MIKFHGTRGEYFWCEGGVDWPRCRCSIVLKVPYRLFVLLLLFTVVPYLRGVSLGSLAAIYGDSRGSLHHHSLTTLSLLDHQGLSQQCSSFFSNIHHLKGSFSFPSLLHLNNFCQAEINFTFVDGTFLYSINNSILNYLSVSLSPWLHLVSAARIINID